MFNSYDKKKVYVPNYGWDWQDSDSSITKGGRYDLRRFSAEEADVILRILSGVKQKYPCNLRSMGLANESYPVVYKPRYVLFEIIIQLFGESEKSVDQFAVALAYESKGAFYRKKSLAYIERCIDDISPQFMEQFTSYLPLGVYTKIAQMYESEHDYDKSILFYTCASSYSDTDYFLKKIDSVKETKSRNPKKRNLKMKQEQIEFEADVRQAAQYFIECSGFSV